MAKLTAKQKRFAEEYLVDKNATQAATRAGYSPTSAGDVGRRLVGKSQIKSVIDAGLVAQATDAKERAEEAIVTKQWVIDRLKENVERAMQSEPVLDSKGRETGEYTYQGTVANGALKLLGQELGMFVERLDHTTAGQPLPPASVTVTLVRPSPEANRLHALAAHKNGNGTG